MEGSNRPHDLNINGNKTNAGLDFFPKESLAKDTRVSLFTLGCKVNQVETEALREEFVHNGYQIVDFSDAADIYVINTCAVTRTAEKKSRAIMRRAKRRSPHSLVVVTGCYGQVAKSDLAALPEVDLVVPNPDKEYLVERLNQYLKQREIIPDYPVRQLRPVRYTFHHPRTRGFIKIQDGCENYCSYCIVPLARGPVRSKAPHHVLEEAQSMVDHDYRELVLNGIHLGQYGKDLEGCNLTRLVELFLAEVTGDYRVRLGSLEPNELNKELVDLVVKEPRLCNHLHIPLQSGSDVILEAMNRTYTAAQYLEILEGLYSRQPKMGLTADVMVGFPGEGEREFKETRRLIEDSPLNDLHVFRFSPRPGTRAAVMENQISEEIKNERSQELIELGHCRRSKFLQGLIGAELEVLTEENTPGGLRGLSDNYVDVIIDQTANINHFYRTRMQKIEGSGLLGKVVGDSHPAET